MPARTRRPLLARTAAPALCALLAACSSSTPSPVAVGSTSPAGATSGTASAAAVPPPAGSPSAGSSAAGSWSDASTTTSATGPTSTSGGASTSSTAAGTTDSSPAPSRATSPSDARLTGAAATAAVRRSFALLATSGPYRSTLAPIKGQWGWTDAQSPTRSHSVLTDTTGKRVEAVRIGGTSWVRADSTGWKKVPTDETVEAAGLDLVVALVAVTFVTSTSFKRYGPATETASRDPRRRTFSVVLDGERSTVVVDRATGRLLSLRSGQVALTIAYSPSIRVVAPA